MDSQIEDALIVSLLKEATDVAILNLPTRGSLIAYKLLFNVYLFRRNGEEPTIKAIFASIPYSDMGIRYHLRKLIEDGWIELKPSTIDKRTKVCLPTDKLNYTWTRVIQAIREELSINH